MSKTQTCTLKNLNIRTGTASCNGVDIVYEDWGDIKAPPMILIMGLGCQLIHWPETLCHQLVRKGFRIIRFDNRDSGLSGNTNNGIKPNIALSLLRAKLFLPIKANYTLFDMADDTLGLMSHLNIEKAHLVGVSMGGIIAQIISGTHQNKVISLCSLMSTTNHPWLPQASLTLLPALLGSRTTKSLNGKEFVIQQQMKVWRVLTSPSDPVSEKMLRDLIEQGIEFVQAE